MRLPTVAAVLVALVIAVPAEPASWQPREGKELIGRQAPEWEGLVWLNSPDLTLGRLRGKVVLIRFWFTDCSLCAATAPALNDLHKRYGAAGLQVIGIHHPKTERGFDPDYVRKGARDLGFHFPVAQDRDWKTVKRYWLKTGNRSFTSASFLIDKDGRIRWVHDGGEFHAGGGSRHSDCAAALASLEEKIQELLSN